MHPEDESPAYEWTCFTTTLPVPLDGIGIPAPACTRRRCTRRTESRPQAASLARNRLPAWAHTASIWQGTLPIATEQASIAAASTIRAHAAAPAASEAPRQRPSLAGTPAVHAPSTPRNRPCAAPLKQPDARPQARRAPAPVVPSAPARAAEPPRPAKVAPPSRRSQRGIWGTIGIVALAIHAGIALAFAMMHLASQCIAPDEAPEFTAAPVSIAPEPVVVQRQEVARRTRESCAPPPPRALITAGIPSDFALPELHIPDATVPGRIGGCGNGTGLTGNGRLGAGMQLPRIEAIVGGIRVEATRIGVLLDVSRSMTPYLKRVREQIDKQFKDAAAYREANGCRLDDKSPAFKGMLALVEKEGVDTIYWFCDLKDKRDPETLDTLARKFKEAGVKLYIRSISENPDPALRRLVRDSGGSVRVKDMKDD